MTGAQLKNEIKKRGYTLRSVADRMGMSEQSFGRMLKGDDVSSKLMEAAAEEMGISVADFYRTGEVTKIANDKGPSDTRLLDIIQARDRQLDKCQEQLDKLIAILKGA